MTRSTSSCPRLILFLSYSSLSKASGVKKLASGEEEEVEEQCADNRISTVTSCCSDMRPSLWTLTHPLAPPLWLPFLFFILFYNYFHFKISFSFVGHFVCIGAHDDVDTHSTQPNSTRVYSSTSSSSSSSSTYYYYLVVFIMSGKKKTQTKNAQFSVCARIIFLVTTIVAYL